MGYVKTTNRVIDDVQWEDGNRCRFKITNAIDIWKINTATLNDNSGTLYSLLDKQEADRSTRFHFKKDRLSFILSHGVLRLLLGQYLHQPALELKFAYNKYGKPRLQNTGGLQFNISHSTDYTLIAIAATEIGADIEKIKLNFDFAELLPGNFSETEASYLKSRSAGHFFKLWTRKEALAKLTGRGLNDDLRLLPGNDGLNVVTIPSYASSNILVSSFIADGNYYCSIAVYGNTAQLGFYDFNKLL